MGFLAVDTETEGLGYFDQPFCVTFAYRGAGYLYSEFVGIENRERIQQLLDGAEHLVFHNPKFDMQKLELVGFTFSQDCYHIHDTEALSHLLNEQRPKRLKSLAKELLGEETDEAKALAVARRRLGLRKEDGYSALPREVLEPYAIKDAEFTLRLFELMYPHVVNDDELHRLYREEQELMVVLYDMERRGMGVDVEYLEAMARDYARQILETDLIIRDLAGEDFNPNSPKQIQVAFAERGITLESTAKKVLLEMDDELAQAIIRLRTLSKIHSTYLRAMLHEQRDGVIHPNFKQYGTRGRRFSSGGTEES